MFLKPEPSPRVSLNHWLHTCCWALSSTWATGGLQELQAGALDARSAPPKGVGEPGVSSTEFHFLPHLDSIHSTNRGRGPPCARPCVGIFLPESHNLVRERDKENRYDNMTSRQGQYSVGLECSGQTWFLTLSWGGEDYLEEVAPKT